VITDDELLGAKAPSTTIHAILNPDCDKRDISSVVMLLGELAGNIEHEP
jgi:hypothetical protein